jgi:acyl-CoA thioester hydrolase
MLSLRIEPRFSETDTLKHINNTVVPVWFEHARTPLFKLFNPNLDVNNWNLIIKRIEVEYLKQIYLDAEVEIKTYIEEIRTSSCVVAQEVWQRGDLAASGKTIMVYFDYKTQNKQPIPDSIKAQLVKLQRVK